MPSYCTIVLYCTVVEGIFARAVGRQPSCQLHWLTAQDEQLQCWKDDQECQQECQERQEYQLALSAHRHIGSSRPRHTKRVSQSTTNDQPIAQMLRMEPEQRQPSGLCEIADSTRSMMAIRVPYALRVLLSLRLSLRFPNA